MKSSEIRAAQVTFRHWQCGCSRASGGPWLARGACWDTCMGHACGAHVGHVGVHVECMGGA